MFKKKSMLALIPLLGIFGAGAIGSMNFNRFSISPVKAEEEPTIESAIKVKKYRRSDNYDYGVLYENTAVKTQEDLETVKTNISTALEGVDEEVDYTVTTIELLADSSLNYTILTEGNRFELLLKGHTWNLDSESPWELYCENFLIQGENGTIDALDSEDAAFSISIDSTVEDPEVEANDTTFTNFASSSSATFDIDGNNEEESRLYVGFTNCNFLDCESETEGGAFSITRSFDTKFTNCSFEDCSSEYGGAICIEDILYKALMEECTFSQCDADFGGAINIYTSDSDDENPSIFELNACTIEDCSADFGGFAYIEDDGINFCSLDLDTTVTDCDATSFGGAIYIDASRANVEGFTFAGCSSEYGGAIYTNGLSNIVSDCKFKDCTVSEKGPAIYSEEAITLQDDEYVDANDNPISEDDAVYIASAIKPVKKQTPNSSTALWVMGSLILAALIGSVITICLVFKKRKE